MATIFSFQLWSGAHYFEIAAKLLFILLGQMAQVSAQLNLNVTLGSKEGRKWMILIQLQNDDSHSTAGSFKEVSKPHIASFFIFEKFLPSA